MAKKINYLARNFSDYRSELIKFSKEYYPELADDLNDSSVMSWFIDLIASVGDNLSYSIDRAYQETNANTATMKGSILNLARSNGLKIPGPKASTCEIRLSCTLPVSSKDISQPDWDFAPVVRRTSTVAAGSTQFHLTEDVDFASQFNSDAYSNRTFSPVRNANGSITGYNVSKTAIASNGSTKIFKKVVQTDDVQPFMQVILPDSDVMNVESIIFKEAADFSEDPDIQEFYYGEEEFKLKKEAATTYRFFEVNSLADQWRFDSETDFDEGLIKDTLSPEIYDDYTETIEYESGDSSGDTSIYQNSQRTTRIYRGKWKPLTQKFITEYTDNGYLKIIFGSGVAYDEIPSGSTKYAEYRASKIVNNDMLGVIPKAGWTMYVLYNTGGGVSSNLGAGSINSISTLNVRFHNTTVDAREKGKVLNSMTVTNTTPSIAGKDAPSSEEIKYLTKYNAGSQERCVTVKDYKARLMMMPPKFGAPFRASAIEDNNKIVISLLNITSDGKLDNSLPETLVNNITEYLSHYKSLGDYLELRSGRIYNLAFAIDVFVDKTYNEADVIGNVISTIQNYMDVKNHDMGEDIFIGDLKKEITLVDGVLSLISLRVFNVYSDKAGQHSSDKAPYPALTEKDGCSSADIPTFNAGDGSTSYAIDLDAIDQVLYSDYNSMLEIQNPSTDITVRCKLR